MKVHQAIVVFLFVFLAVTAWMDAKQKTLYTISNKQMRYGSIIETAINDAASVLVTRDRGEQPVLQKEEAIEVLFHSLYAGFGVMHDSTIQQEIQSSIPLILITDQDGFYFYYLGEYEENGTNMSYVWSEKIPYGCYLSPEIDSQYGTGAVTSEEAYFLGLTLNDTLYLLQEEGERVYFQTSSDMNRLFPKIAVLENEEDYDVFRREMITNRIMEKMSQYINTCNRIGKQYGISYDFSIPYLDDSDWARTIEDISILVVFQGYPYGNHIIETYNQIELSGARTNKKKYYYLTMQDGQCSYHSRNCNKIGKDSAPYDSKRECALMGAYPCRECMP